MWVVVGAADSGVGAGIDSYYEYLLKAYIMLGDETYLDRFNKVRHWFINWPGLACNGKKDVTDWKSCQPVWRTTDEEIYF